jgi:hypothetical protein
MGVAAWLGTSSTSQSNSESPKGCENRFMTV